MSNVIGFKEHFEKKQKSDESAIFIKYMNIGWSDPNMSIEDHRSLFDCMRRDGDINEQGDITG